MDRGIIRMELIKDCLSRRMSLSDIAVKWNIDIDEVLTKYLEEKSKYTQQQIDDIMNEVYYKYE